MLAFWVWVLVVCLYVLYVCLGFGLQPALGSICRSGVILLGSGCVYVVTVRWICCGCVLISSCFGLGVLLLGSSIYS